MPVFDNVSIWLAVLPTVMVPKPKIDGLAFNWEDGACAAVPVTVTEEDAAFALFATLVAMTE